MQRKQFRHHTTAATCGLAAVVCLLLLPRVARGDLARPEVLVYYANETSTDDVEQKNYETIIGWLESSDLPKAQEIAEQLRGELKNFAAAVAAETAVLREQVPNCRIDLPVVVFTNRSVREGYFYYFREGETEFQTAEFTPPTSENYILHSNRLAMRETFARALAAVEAIFPAQDHDYVLITKSHGATDMAMTVRLTRQHESTTREQLLAGIASSAGPSTSPKLGVTKDAYFDVLAAAGRDHNMRFPLVFMESCRGVIDPVLQQELPTNIDRLYTSGDRRLRYSTLDYQALVEAASPDRPFSVVLDEFLSPRYLALYRTEKPSLSWWIWLLFAPIVMLLLASVTWLAWRLRHKVGVVTPRR